MSDLEMMLELFDRINIDYIYQTIDNYNNRPAQIIDIENIDWDHMIEINGECGYVSLWHEFYFLNGKFVKHGAWE